MSRLAEPGAIVCVPARDEADTLPTLLASLAAQRGFGPERRLGVVIVANGCSDATADVARAFGQRADSLALRVLEMELPPAAAHVGTARRAALDAGAAWLDEAGLANGILLSSDADARVPTGWVQANLAALRAAEIVGGALVIDPAGLAPGLARLHAAIARYWQEVRAIEDRLDPPAHDPAPRHGDHTGASLALTARLYREVGGLPPLPGGEDNALVARVVEAGGRLRHDPAVSVTVSDRVIGRASGGMAEDMKRREAVVRGEFGYLLPPPAFWRALVEDRAALRAAWRRGRAPAAALLRERGLDAEAIAAIDMADCPNEIAFVERASRRLPPRPAPAEVPVEEALALFGPLDEDVRGAA